MGSLFAMALVIGGGLVLRSRTVSFPDYIPKYGGDALWALMVFFAVGAVLCRLSTVRVGLFAFCIACVVEFSQLYHAPWIDAVRNTRLGALAIGSTFNWPDFIAYAAGVGFGILSEIAGRGISRGT